MSPIPPSYLSYEFENLVPLRGTKNGHEYREEALSIVFPDF
jgi:hypothetical protein